MKKIDCIIVDDEPLARELLQGYIEKLVGWEIKASCRSVAEAYEALYQNEIDVVFLDINLPDVNGVAFLGALKNPPHVIFTTAHAEHAVKAFDLKAIDYLLKPITESRFREAIDKVEKLSNAVESIDKPEEADHVFLKHEGKLIKILFDAILYVEAVKDFSKLYLKNGVLLLSAHLKIMEDSLPASKFIRVHRSYIVAIAAITALQGNVIEIGKQQLPVGNTYKDELMKKLSIR